MMNSRLKLSDYLELRDSVEFNSATTPSKEHTSTTVSSVTSPITATLTNNSKSSKSTNMASTTNNFDKPWDKSKKLNVPISLPDNKSRPLPEVKDSNKNKVAIPPYYNVTNELDDVNHPITQSVQHANQNKRQSYMELPQTQLSNQETNGYAELQSTDHYELLAPMPSGRVGKTNSGLPSMPLSNMASKKHLSVALCVVLFGLVIVLSATLTSIFIARDNINDKVSTKLSTLLKKQVDTKTELLKRLTSLYSSCEKASDLRVIYGNSCFCLYREQMSWYAAKEFCLSKGYGVHLAEIYCPEVNNFLMPILQASLTNLGIWLGASDLAQEGVWRWNYTGKQVEKFEPSQWGPGQPSSVSHVGQPEHCMDVYNWNVATFIWNDHRCDELKPFLCKSSYTDSRCFC
ncbi:hypothetical protein Btru_038635 [Bulinus truncatus]|nr:hypothetical protein Btru_038635 [Bulinus truncatus]